MFSIGEFATLGRVTVRMLRHYDAIGLLTPAAVDPTTGYRRYTASQLRRLNRLVALKDLGFPLDQLGPVLDDALDAEQLRRMYRLRAAELAERIDTDRARLSRVEGRLRIIESESGVNETPLIDIRPLPTVTVIRTSDVAPGGDHTAIGPVMTRLYGLLGDLCARGVLVPVGPSVATYSPTDDGAGLVCSAGLVVAAGSRAPVGVDEVEVTVLPGVEHAAVLVHDGAPETFDAAYQRLALWVDDHGYRADGTARETYVVSVPEPPESWRTEIALPVT